MIRLTYDPLRGELMPDGKVVEIAKRLIDEHRAHNDASVKAGRGPICATQTFANELFFHAFRVQVKLGMVPCEEVEVTFEDHKISINKDGRCHEWPAGFCDHMDVLLTALFD